MLSLETFSEIFQTLRETSRQQECDSKDLRSTETVGFRFRILGERMPFTQSQKSKIISFPRSPKS